LTGRQQKFCVADKLSPTYKKGKGMVIDIAPLNDALQRFTTLEGAADWHWL